MGMKDEWTRENGECTDVFAQSKSQSVMCGNCSNYRGESFHCYYLKNAGEKFSRKCTITDFINVLEKH